MTVDDLRRKLAPLDGTLEVLISDAGSGLYPIRWAEQVLVYDDGDHGRWIADHGEPKFVIR